MDWVETTGKSIGEAKESALDVLGVEERDVEFEILEEGRSSFLGIGRRPARVRARLRPSFPAPKRDSRRTQKRRSSSSERPETGDRVKTEDSSPAPRSSVSEQKETVPMEDVRGEVEEGNQRSESRPVLSRVELATLAQSFLAGLLQEFGLAGEVLVSSLDDEAMELEVNGNGLGALVGSRGAVLSAIQEITRSVVQSQAGERAGRVSVDVAGYRRKRRDALEGFTREQALAVLETGEERSFEPMTAPDRKIVHDTAASVSGVATRSEGQEPSRFVVIYRGVAEEADDEPVTDAMELDHSGN
ncbi:MAG: RNA-binding cell elongation regulator Jag/EloR [Ferrimicrobium sp.]